MSRGEIREKAVMATSVATTIGGLALTYIIGNHIDNGNLLNDLVSWNPNVATIVNISKYGGEMLGAEAIAFTSALIPSVVNLGVAHGELIIARKRRDMAQRELLKTRNRPRV